MPSVSMTVNGNAVGGDIEAVRSWWISSASTCVSPARTWAATPANVALVLSMWMARR